MFFRASHFLLLSGGLEPTEVRVKLLILRGFQPQCKMGQRSEQSERRSRRSLRCLHQQVLKWKNENAEYVIILKKIFGLNYILIRGYNVLKRIAAFLTAASPKRDCLENRPLVAVFCHFLSLKLKVITPIITKQN